MSPLKNFICPDREQIAITDCLRENGCRMGKRCATRSYLLMAGADRPWKGKPSCTMLLAGTMNAFLRIKHDYATNPDSRAFMILGTRAHKEHETAGLGDEFSMLEQAIFDGDISGIPDGIETENGISTLFDVKTTGSFRICKALGIYTDEEPIEGEVFKSGPRKGTQKMRKMLKYDPAKADVKDWALQTNFYRLLIRKKFGIDCKRIKIEAIIRDGGILAARQRGIFSNIYYFDIPILPDEEVETYFETKRRNLLQAVKQGYWNDVCTDEEQWDGIRCQRYCDVAQFCPYGVYLKEQREADIFMPIKGKTGPTQIPRLGKIRLGIKKHTAAGKEYPAEVDYFILDPETPIPEERERYLSEFTRLYGEKPQIIDVMLPTSIIDMNLVMDYKRYGGNNLLQCKGNGETATCTRDEYAAGLQIIGKTEEGLTQVKCLGESCPIYLQKKCQQVGVLNVLLPKLPGLGVWQIVTHSEISMQNLLNTMHMNMTLLKRIHLLPATLERRPVKTNHEGKAMAHYCLFLDIKGSLAEVQKLAQGDPTTIMLQLPQADPMDVTASSEIEAMGVVEAQDPSKPAEPAAKAQLTAKNTKKEVGSEAFPVQGSIPAHVEKAIEATEAGWPESGFFPEKETTGEPLPAKPAVQMVTDMQLIAIKQLIPKLGWNSEKIFLECINLDAETVEKLTAGSANVLIQKMQAELKAKAK